MGFFLLTQMFVYFSLFIHFLPVILCANLLTKISPEENEEIQKMCKNGDFTGLNGTLNPMIIDGDMAQPEEYPWVAALYFGTMAGENNTNFPFSYDGKNYSNTAFCGGTIISQRHIITAQHCIRAAIEGIEGIAGAAANWWIQVGGVCTEVNTEQDCPVMDMQQIPVKRAIYSSKKAIVDLGPYSLTATDFAIIELGQDLDAAPFKSTNNNAGTPRIQVGCLPTQAIYSLLLHIYGWGNTEIYYNKNDSAGELLEFNPSAHLMEITLPVVDNDPGDKWKVCQSKKLVCAHSNETNGQKSGASGDSGTGIVGIHSGMPIIEAITVAGLPKGSKVSIGLLLFPLLQEICSQTGVCQKKAWIGVEQMEEENGQTLLHMDGLYEYKGGPIP